jgi:hypothetical protein
MTIYTAVQAVRAEVPPHPGLHILIVSNPTDTRRSVYLAHDSFCTVLYMYGAIQQPDGSMETIYETVGIALANVGDYIGEYFTECYAHDE